MGKFSSLQRQAYWLSRFLLTLPDPPPKEIPFIELTDEQRMSRYAGRAYYILTGEKFDRKAFKDMMRPYEPPQK